MRQKRRNGFIQSSKRIKLKIRDFSAAAASFVMVRHNIAVKASGACAVKDQNDPGFAQLFQVPVDRCQTQMRHRIMEHIIKLLRRRMTFHRTEFFQYRIPLI